MKRLDKDKKRLQLAIIILILFLIGIGISLAFAQTDETLEAEQTAIEDSLSEDVTNAVENEALQSDKSVQSEEDELSQLEEGLRQKISLDLRGIDIVETIKFLSMKGNLNIVTSRNVSGRITLFLKDVTIGDTLELILLTNNLAEVTKKNIITIMTETEYEQLYGRKYVDNRQIRTLKLKYAKPSNVGTALETLKSSIGKIIMDDATGTIILIDIPEKLAEMEKAVLDLDLGLVQKEITTTSKVFELDYAEVEDVEAKISEMLTEGIGSVRFDERTNRLIVYDLPNKIAEVEELITAFDAKTREVMIEAKVVEITLSDDFAFGIDWEKLFTTSTKNINFEGSFPFSQPSGTTGNLGRISIGTWRPGFYTDEQTEDETFTEGGLDLRRTQQILTFLKAIGKVKIISSPHIAVIDSEEAKIMVGTRQPYATSTVSQSETTSTTSWSAEFVDVGVTLTVTPNINKNGFVKMHIKPEVSTLTDWFEITDDSGNEQIRLPEVDTSNAATDVLVHDGRTIIIAGLIKDTESLKERKFPFLGDIPVVGNLFKSQSKSLETKEIVILLTPHIITGEEDLLFVQDNEKVRKPRKE
jgi:type II secretory pathway component GspD/PulD (secretin)